ncbi:hypothetical protein P4N68_10240 [Corynebacterium felinum]|uniref:Secreted protein n=1 Tax=Corynebacterium felinum TaxID=131318 RepID=A0ABU2B5B2_9CORY|nr:hypothetical protein [Corynebacterium felinum]MDF5821451.1 hypothetical protein [Corynebacterium felinum]MDR7353802.1 hypothetical protein [Corynebacterium felinum]WJY95981.1 hypothetical protein CFELI_12000 [Corynebacterium felinum]
MERRNRNYSYSRPPSRPAPEPAEPRLPPEVYYRRRRAAAIIGLAAVAVLIMVIAALVSKEDSPTPAALITSSAAPTAHSTPASTSVVSETTSSEQAKDEGVKEVDPSQSAEPTEDPERKTTCNVDDLEISASTNHPFYAAEDLPSFYMTVKNPTSADCVIDLGRDPLRFEVYSLDANQRVWSDIDCNAPVGTGEQTFRSGQERKFEAKWSRTTSTPETCQGRQSVPAGSYYLHTVIGTNASAPIDFHLQ